MCRRGAGSYDDRGFRLKSDNAMGASYAVAKAALNALTVSWREGGNPSVLLNAVCPGFTATFPGGEAMGARPVAEGAAGIAWATLMPEGGPSGSLFRDRTLTLVRNMSNEAPSNLVHPKTRAVTAAVSEHCSI